MTEENVLDYPVSREKLYELAWSQPMTAIAKIYGVSSSYLARIYSQLNVPRPAAGYWAKVAAGKTPPIPSLPEAEIDQEVGWDRHNDFPMMSDRPAAPPAASPALPPLPPTTKRELPVKRKLPQLHSLIRGAKAHFLKTRDSDIGYLRPYKKCLVDLIVSRSGLDKALDIANALFLEFEERGYRVAHPVRLYYFERYPVDEREKPGKNKRILVNHWSPDRETLVYVDGTPVGLTIFEISESIEVRYVNGEYIPVANPKAKTARHQDFGWTTHKDFPTGRFCLQVYSPHQQTKWVKQWTISSTEEAQKLAKQLSLELPAYAKEIAVLAAQAEAAAEKLRIEHEEQRQRWKIETELKMQKKAFEDSRTELLQVIAKWSELKSINAFLEEISQALREADDATKTALEIRLQQAREVVTIPNVLEILREWKTPAEKLELANSKRYY